MMATSGKIGYKDRFYSELQQDYNENITNSFIFRYMRGEKEKNFRIQMKRQYKEREDTEEGRNRYAKFIVNSLLEEEKLRKSYSSIRMLVPFIRQGLGLSDEEDVCVQERLFELEGRLEDEEIQTDFPMEMLEEITEELLCQYGDPSGRKESYVQLAECFLDFQMGNADEGDYLLIFLRILSDNSKLNLDENQKEILLAYGRKIGGDNVFDGERKIKGKYIKMIQILEEMKRSRKEKKVSLGTEQLEKLNEEMLVRILKLDVQTFMYDVGYPITLDKDGGRSHKSRKKDRMMDMLDAYYKEKDIFLEQQQDKSLQEKIEFCKKMYKRMRKSKWIGTVLPVQIDSLTGAGLYIMGKKYFPDSVWKKWKCQGSCCCACFYWNDLWYSSDNLGMEFRWIGDSENDWNECIYPNLTEAVRWYREGTKKAANEYFKEWNGDNWNIYRKGILGEEPMDEEEILTVGEEEIARIKKEEFGIQ